MGDSGKRIVILDLIDQTWPVGLQFKEMNTLKNKNTTSEQYFKAYWCKVLEYGRKKGLRDNAEDFAQYASIRKFKGSNSPLKFIYIDFLREHFGDARTKRGKFSISQRNYRELREGYSSRSTGYDFSVEVAGIDARNDARIKGIDREIPRYVERLCAFLTFNEHMVFNYYYMQQKNDKTIANILNLTENRISQLRKQILSKIAQIEKYENMSSL